MKFEDSLPSIEEIVIVVTKSHSFHGVEYKTGEKYRVFKQSITNPFDMSEVYIVINDGGFHARNYIKKEYCSDILILREKKLERIVK